WRQTREDVETLRRLIRRSSRRAEETLGQLDDARRKAEEQDNEKLQFMAKIGHELRTPLNTILGYATLLHEDATEAGDQAAAADLERIMIAGRRLSMAVNDMLGWSKIESGTANLERKVINVQGMVEEVVSDENVHARKKVSVAVDFDHELGIIVGDPEKLHHCLLNLIAGAAEKSEENKVTLSVTRLEKAGVQSVCFLVETSGGTSDAPVASRSKHLPFSKQSSDGGLRFAVARRLAKLMGGDCIVEETSSKRVIIRMTLPITPAERREVSRERDELGARALRRSTRGKCALIIDDDEAALDLMRRWLEQMDYHVFVALDGETGLKLAREEQADLILLDGFLPGRSGYEVLAELRGDPVIGRTPVIFVTVDDDRSRGIECGASDYLRKPLTQEALRAVVDVYAGTSAGKILIIDDDEDAAELIRRSAEEVGFSTRHAANGLEGLAMVSQERPAAIVLDVRMPLMDGFSVIEHLARTEDLSEIPIVVVSGQDMNIAEHRRLTAAAHRVFTKGTVSPRQIAQSLQEVVA
ncbi:MAG TPA: response regulator, partial [Sphingomicrobium sp.]|nr:response regulator [Sphingomicrobium sp.]